MKTLERHLATIITVAAGLCITGCSDDQLDSATGSPEGVGTEAIAIDGEENYLVLPATTDLATIDLTDADFFTLTSDGTIYCERNDGDDHRIATVRATDHYGQPITLTYRQAPAQQSTDGQSLRQFYRHHGIGYSYNAINGNYCSLRDFRCQILNRAVLSQIDEELGTELLNYNIINDITDEYEVYTSVVDYVAQSNFAASVEGSIVFFSGSASQTCAVFEDGVKESYLLHNRASTVNAEYSLNYNDIALYAKEYPKMLTSSFRYAISKIGDKLSVDDFIYRYGTHVVVFSRLGASMTLDVQVDKIKFESREYEEALSKAAIATLFKSASGTSEYEKNYGSITNCMGKNLGLNPPYSL